MEACENCRCYHKTVELLYPLCRWNPPPFPPTTKNSWCFKYVPDHETGETRMTEMVDRVKYAKDTGITSIENVPAQKDAVPPKDEVDNGAYYRLRDAYDKVAQLLASNIRLLQRIATNDSVPPLVKIECNGAVENCENVGVTSSFTPLGSKTLSEVFKDEKLENRCD